MYIDNKKVVLDIHYDHIFEMRDDLPIKVELSRKEYDRLVKDYGEYPIGWQITDADPKNNYIKIMFYSDGRVRFGEILIPNRFITYEEYIKYGIEGGDKNAKNKSKKNKARK
jgi:hypothetical protein